MKPLDGGVLHKSEVSVQSKVRLKKHFYTG
jgi:hypothetical protein